MGRFISADSIVPGNASGGMDGIALKPLTVDFHEPGFVAKLSSKNQFGPWFTLSDNEKQQLGSPMGPANPQSLNRYSYVQNNPLKYVDPSGHSKNKVGTWDANYDDVCQNGGNYTDCDVPGSRKIYNENHDTLKAVCVAHQCQYEWSGSGLFLQFKSDVDSEMSNLANTGISAPVLLGTTLALEVCAPTAGLTCVIAIIGFGGVAIASGYYVLAAQSNLDSARKTFQDIVNNPYKVRPPF